MKQFTPIAVSEPLGRCNFHWPLECFCISAMQQPNVNVETFAYKTGRPVDPRRDLECAVIDCRGLPNPWLAGFRNAKGDDPLVIGYLIGQNPELVEALLKQAEEAVQAGKTRIFFGCLHGRHRSVALAAEFKRRAQARLE